MAVNFDPRCPAPPELTYGLPPPRIWTPTRSPSCSGTSRSEGSTAAGSPPTPRPDEFVINIGDQLAALSVVAPHVDQPPVPVRGGGAGGHVVGLEAIWDLRPSHLPWLGSPPAARSTRRRPSRSCCC
ncbi:hypothetical protein U9M48_040612 [Paspalum notatum var. saurae]|uniref:Uncharacterized protein n=1 Tax=Paspalum notatum var. saurae TaxID=547442 RepID=A0AAQ3XDY5_PASNO